MIKIKRIKITDWKNIRKDVLNVEHKSFEKKLWFVERHGDFDSFKHKDSINLLIYIDDVAVGYLMSSTLENDSRSKKDPHYGKNNTIHLESIAVIPEYQVKGLGRMMFKKFLSLASKKYSRIVLDATSEGMVRLATSEGFKKIKFFKRWEGNRPSWFMEKTILDI